MGFERSDKNNTVCCFLSGDRRFLRNITKDKIRNVEQKSRTNPLRRAKKASDAFALLAFFVSQ